MTFWRSSGGTSATTSLSRTLEMTSVIPASRSLSGSWNTRLISVADEPETA